MSDLNIRPTDEIQTRIACEACGGSGNSESGERPYCGHCRREFDEVKLSDSISDWGRLPCGHHKSELTYTPPECRACNGSGWVARWVKLADLAEALAPLLTGKVTAKIAKATRLATGTRNF